MRTLTESKKKSFQDRRSGRNELTYLNAAKDSLIGIVEASQKAVDNEKANIEVAMVAFDTQTYPVCRPTRLQKGGNTDQIKEKINNLVASSDTHFEKGLIPAMEQLETMAKTNKTGKRLFVLLSDGETQPDETLIKQFHRRLDKENAVLCVIGIGAHNEDVMKALAQRTSPSMGIYINTKASKSPNQTTNEAKAIANAVHQIFNQTITPETQLQLTSKQLSPEQWSVKGYSVSPEGTCTLKPVQDGAQIKEHIKINPHKITSPLDLKDVSFELTATDSKGKSTVFVLPWNPTTIIDPAVFA